MELVKYDGEKRTVTMTLSKDEFLDIHSVLGGILSIYQTQDPLILGVQEDRLREVYGGVRGITKQLHTILFGK